MAVLDLRRGKGMVLDADDHDTWSVGSFFTNPVLPAADVPDEPDLPRWPAGADRVKLPAAWLIEHSGFRRGRPGPGGRVALSGKHVLALSNRGDGTACDLLALAREVARRGARTVRCRSGSGARARRLRCVIGRVAWLAAPACVERGRRGECSCGGSA